MDRFIIFANGRMESPPGIQAEIQSSTMILAADGGIHNCKRLGILPNVIIGDLDSIEADEIQSYMDAGVELIRYPTHKDETDLELALRYAVENKAQEMIVLGGLGDRWDMTIANILLIAHPTFANITIRFLDGSQELALIRPNITTTISGKPGDIVSLIPIAGDVHGVTTSGLEYPLHNEDLSFGASRGVSNVLIQDSAQIFLRDGLLLCTRDRKARKSTI